MPTAVCNGRDLESTSDAIDNGLFLLFVCPSAYRTHLQSLVNILKGKLWNEQSEFDELKDKTQFRQYHDACDRVKSFYKEQHGLCQTFPCLSRLNA